MKYFQADMIVIEYGAST